MPGLRNNALSQALDVAGSLLAEDTLTKANEAIIGRVSQSGVDGQITAATKRFTSAGATFTAASIGDFIRITGATNPGNNNEWLITAYVDATNVTLGQATGLTDEGPGMTWSHSRAYSLEDDLNYARTDRKDIKGTATYKTAVPTYTDPTATGTPKTANLTNIAGNTLDAKTEVVSVRQTAVKMRPSIGGTDLDIAIGDETAVFTKFHFFANDVGSYITVSGAVGVGVNGTYRITAVTDGQTIELEGLNPPGIEAGLTWVLEGAQKAVLSSRPHADSTDRRGIPLADTGAYDETRYDATFVDVVDPIEGGGFVSNGGLPVWARSFGDQLSAKEASEGVFFNVQFKTGDNDAGASTRAFETLRTGTDGQVTAATKNFTSATAAFTQADVGRYLAIYDCQSDGNPGYFQIASVTSATVCVVTKTVNFVLDAGSGSLKWQISRYPASLELYNGDRYTMTAMSETAHRTTMIGGILSDAELVEDIREIRDAIGIVDGDTDLDGKLTNTGNYFIWSDLSANPTVVDALNELNEQVGNRDYTGAILVDDETITASLQRLADAISASNVVRYIERLAAAIPAGTTHDIPAAYTLDGTGNGRNLWVFWRGVLRDPGTLVTNDDYAETSGSGGAGGVGQITPYSQINASEHVNYFILS